MGPPLWKLARAEKSVNILGDLSFFSFSGFYHIVC